MATIFALIFYQKLYLKIALLALIDVLTLFFMVGAINIWDGQGSVQV